MQRGNPFLFSGCESGLSQTSGLEFISAGYSCDDFLLSLPTRMQVYKALRHGAQPVAVKVLAVSAAGLARLDNALAHRELPLCICYAASEGVLSPAVCMSSAQIAMLAAGGGRGALSVPGGGVRAGDCAAARLPGPKCGRVSGEAAVVVMLCMLWSRDVSANVSAAARRRPTQLTLPCTDGPADLHLQLTLRAQGACIQPARTMLVTECKRQGGVITIPCSASTWQRGKRCASTSGSASEMCRACIVYIHVYI